eukprot:384228_1
MPEEGAQSRTRVLVSHLRIEDPLSPSSQCETTANPFLSSETLRKRFGEVGCSGGTTQTWRHRLSPCSGCYGSNGSPSPSLQYLEDEVDPQHYLHTPRAHTPSIMRLKNRPPPIETFSVNRLKFDWVEDIKPNPRRTTMKLGVALMAFALIMFLLNAPNFSGWYWNDVPL